MGMLAELGMDFNSQPALQGAANLDKLSASAGKAEDATDSLSASATKATASLRNIGTGATTSSKATDGYRASTTAATVATQKHAAEMNAAVQATMLAAAGTNTLSDAHAVLNTQAMAATHAIRSMVEGLALGLSPTQILTQQIAHLSYAASGPGGLTGAFGGVLKMFGSFIGVGTLIVGGLLAIGAGITYLYASAINNQKAMEASLTGTGRGAGVTASQLNDLAETAASSSNISVSAARDYAEEYAKSGKIVGNQIEQLVALTQDYATTTGQSGSDASKQLTKDFSDLTSGADDLNKGVGFLDDKTRQYVLTLEAQGDHQKAVQVTIDAMKPSLTSTSDSLTLVGRAWDAIKNAASGAISAMEKAIAPDLSQQLAQLQQERAAMQGNNWGLPTTQIDSDIAKIQQKLAQQGASAAKDAAEQAANDLSQKAGPILRAATPGLSDLQGLKDQSAQIGQISQSSAAMQKLGVTTAQVTQAQDAYTRAIATYIDPATKAQKLAELDIAADAAKTPAAKAAIAAERERIDLSGQVVSSTEAEQKIKAAAAVADASATQAIIDQSKALTLNTSETLKVADAWLQGSAAAADAMATQKAANENLQDGVNISMRASQNLKQAFADQISAAAQSINSTNQQTKAQSAANDAVASGAINYSHADNYIKEYLDTADLEQAKNVALTKGYYDLAASIQDKIDKTKSADAASDAAKDTATLQANTDSMKDQIRLAAMSTDQRDQENAVLEQQHAINGKLTGDQADYIRYQQQQLDLAKQIGAATDAVVTPCEEFPDGFTDQPTVKSKIAAQLEEILS